MEDKSLLTFNLLLRQAGIDPKQVYLLRHQDKRISRKLVWSRSTFEVWRDHREKFETYQKLQAKDRFSKRTFLASFVVTPPPQNETLFVGIYEIRGVGKPPTTLIEDPVSGATVNKHFYYDLRHTGLLEGFQGKLTIDWGKGFLSWCQKADSSDKRITEIRREIKEEPFPGFRGFLKNLDEIPSLWPTWIHELRNAKGIYLLTCKHCGKQYVGKADGDDGFYGRFCEYADGHGGNSDMKVHRTIDYLGYSIAILEANSTPDLGELDRLETLWKLKLGTREWGLNKN